MGLLGTLSHTLTRLARTLMRDNRTLVRGYFEHVYRNRDPWGEIDDPESEQKRDMIVNAVAGQGFGHALEIGCGEGNLALLLAEHVGELTLADISERALRRARERLADKYPVVTKQFDFVADPLPGSYDLVVCQETLVYARPDDLPAISGKILGALEDGGTLLLLHSRSIHDDDSGLEYKDIGAKTVHEIFIADPRTRVTLDETRERFRMTVMSKEAAQPEVA